MIKGGIGTGLLTLAREEAPEAVRKSRPGGARRIGGASPVCGVRAERRRACPDTAACCPETGAGARGMLSSG